MVSLPSNRKVTNTILYLFEVRLSIFTHFTDEEIVGGGGVEHVGHTVSRAWIVQNPHPQPSVHVAHGLQSARHLLLMVHMKS